MTGGQEGQAGPIHTGDGSRSAHTVGKRVVSRVDVSAGPSRMMEQGSEVRPLTLNECPDTHRTDLAQIADYRNNQLLTLLSDIMVA